MYHELTKQQKTKKRLARIFVALCIVAVAAAVALCAVFARQHALEQGAASIRTTILDTAMQCAAIEGSYPSTLKHLEDEYGLSVNHNDYIVTYDCFASNVVPSVTVVPR